MLDFIAYAVGCYFMFGIFITFLSFSFVDSKTVYLDGKPVSNPILQFVVTVIHWPTLKISREDDDAD